MTLNPSTLKSLSIAVLIAGAALAPAVGFAQASSAAATTAAPSSPAKKELIARLVALQRPGVEMLAQQILQQPIARLMQSALGALQQLPAEKRDAAAKAIEADVKKFVDDNAPMMKDKAIKLAPLAISPILEERFTEDELRQLLSWLESPVSKKFNQVNSDLSKALQDKLLADTAQTLEARFTVLQQGVAKQLGIAPPSGSPAASKAAPAKK